MEEINDLIYISRFYGEDSDYIIAGGGNTSYKNDQYIWVKASGQQLKEIANKGFVQLDRNKLSIINTKKYGTNVVVREEEVKQDLLASKVDEDPLRPSVETSIHDIFNYPYVVHTHATYLNAVLCSEEAEKNCRKLFGEDILYIPYVDPGYVLFKEIQSKLEDYRAAFKKEPDVIFMENHGVFVGANDIKKIKEVYANLDRIVKSNIGEDPENKFTRNWPREEMENIVRGLTDEAFGYFESSLWKKIRENGMVDAIRKPFIPDHIVYCKAFPLIVEDVNQLDVMYSRYKKERGYAPKIIALINGGIFVLDNEKSLRNTFEVFADWMKIALLSQYFGGPHHLNEQEINFIENWEVENYRRKQVL